MLAIKNLEAEIDGKEILKGLNLEVRPGEVHAIMGPNGSGKSTLASVIAGNEDYEVTGGSIDFLGEDLLEMGPDERSHAGVFLALGEEPITAKEFLARVKEKAALVELDNKLANRSVNEGFSGGEKKRNEIFQMAMLEPKLGILDETDSGLDIDALKIVANGVNKLRSEDRSFVVVTHYQRLLDYIVPDFVHVLFNGKIVKTGGKELALELEEKGYDWIKKELDPVSI